MMLVIMLIISVLISCSASAPEAEGLSVLSWNAYNLCDDIIDGNELYPDECTTEAFEKRLRITGKIIADSGADIVMLQEIENTNVLRQLVERHLLSYGYSYYGCGDSCGEPFTVGFVSRIRPEHIRFHRTDGPRFIMELVFPTSRENVRIINVHAKSNLGEEEENIESRRAAAKAIMNMERDCLTLVCGDFNEDPFEENEKGKSVCSAADVMYPIWKRKGAIGITGDEDSCYSDVFYLGDTRHGTFWYENRWHIYDMILADGELFDAHGWHLDSYSVIGEGEIPQRWDMKKMAGGSDHLPVVLRMK